MISTTVLIPTINDGPEDYVLLFDIWNEVKRYNNITFQFSNCKFLRPNAVAFLGGLARLIENRNGKVLFDWTTLTEEWLFTNLCQNGFAKAFGHISPSWEGNSIPYREDRNRNPNGIMDYLEHYWIGKGWVHVSSLLSDAIVGKVWEIYNNSFEHSETNIGIYSCGQHFKHHNELTLSVVDFGIGIPVKVRKFLRTDDRTKLLTSAGCLKWAFQQGNTTKIDEPGGLGLDLLREFIYLNKGKLEIYSNDGYVIIDRDGEKYINTGIPFEGTVVNITLRCNEEHYCFKNEIK